MLAAIDWVVITAYLLLSLGIGLYYTRRASRGMDEYFLSGRDTSWWLAGLSMVATTFAADTPLAVTELVQQGGISKNWLWWNMLLSGMLTTFFFARLWRRAAVRTDLEIITLRYSGQIAHVLRGFKAVYIGLVFNALIIGWVNLALVSILQVFFRLDFDTALLYTGLCMLLTTGYAALGGLRGVMVTDAVQFVIAMSGCIILAVLVLNSPQVGGLQGLVSQVPAGSLSFFPEIGGSGLAGSFALGIGSFIAYAGVVWWASWYPGSEPGGGGYVVQRVLSARDEQSGLAATLLFMVLHIAIRPWPWILVALATLVLYPALPPAEAKNAFLYTMRDFLPAGLQGLLLVAFFAAYMSTISTQLNWGASYLINDLYAPYLQPRATEQHLLLAGRLGSVVLMLLSLIVTANFSSVAGLWSVIFELAAGMGLVLILRWYWWRVTAWSELVATVTPAVCYLGLRWVAAATGDEWLQFPGSLFLTVGITAVASLAAMFLLPGTDAATLRGFYQRVQPQGAWGPYATPAAARGQTPLRVLGLCWLLGVLMVYAVLFGVGKLLLQAPRTGAGLLALAAACAAGLVLLSRRWPVFR